MFFLRQPEQGFTVLGIDVLGDDLELRPANAAEPLRIDVEVVEAAADLRQMVGLTAPDLQQLCGR